MNDSFLSSVELYLHHGNAVCRSFTPQSSFRPLYEALVCGVDLGDGKEKSLFVDTGLIHILVVSGAHLVFVERSAKYLRIPRALHFPILIIYSWLTDFGAPLVRALVRRPLASVAREWGFTRIQIEALTTVCILTAYPPWLLSRSFLMSWLCALAMPIALPVFSNRPEANLSLRIYIFLFPFCLASPLTIAWNGLVTPVIGEILFPACGLAYLFPRIVPVTDGMWRGLLFALEIGPRTPPLSLSTWWATDSLVWFPTMLQMTLLIGEWRWRRAIAFSS